MIRPTPHHTTGPFFPAQFITAGENQLQPEGGAFFAEPLVLEGRVLDGQARPAVNVIIELWLPDGHWCRTWTDVEGRYCFHGFKPKPTPSAVDPAWVRPPFFRVLLLGSGIMRPLSTEVFFPGEPLNQHDRQLIAVDPARRDRLIAVAAGDAAGTSDARLYRFDIVLQGRDETPFFED